MKSGQDCGTGAGCHRFDRHWPFENILIERALAFGAILDQSRFRNRGAGDRS
jgi:hypothetical protein